MSHLAANVRRLRKAKGLTQLELMRTSGVTSVKQIETGRILSPHYNHLEALAKALGCTVADLYAAAPAAVRRSRGARAVS